jgi:hypothetical protein
MALLRAKSFYITGVVLLLLLGIALSPILVLHFYQDEIRERIVQELDAQFEGRTELGGFRLSPFANFPYISVDLQGLRFYASKQANAPAIYSIDDAYIGFDVLELIRGNLHLKQISLYSGFVSVEIDESGKVNLLEAKKTQESTSGSSDESFALDLRKIKLVDMKLRLDNRQGDKKIDLHIERSIAALRLQDSLIAFRLDANAVLEHYQTGAGTLLSQKYFELHNDLNYYTQRQVLEIKPGQLALRNGSFDFKGRIDFADQVNLDLEIEGRKKNFDMFVALAPEAVIAAMQQFSTRGDIFFKTTVTGRTAGSNPHISVEMGCENTFFTRKDSRRDVLRDLQFKGYFNTGAENTLASSVFYLESLYGAPENSLIKGMLKVENFENPLINMDFHADIDLRYLPDLLPGSPLVRSSGQVRIDISLQEFVSADSVLAVVSKLQDGTDSQIAFNNVSLQLSNYPHEIKQINGEIQLVGDHLQTRNLAASILENDFRFSLDLDNLLHYLHGDNVEVSFSLAADAGRLAPSELIPPDVRPADSTDIGFWNDVIYDFHAELDIHSTTRMLQNYRYVPTLAIDFHDFRFRTELYPNVIKDIRGRIDVNDEHIKLSCFSCKIGESSLEGHMQIAPIAPLFNDSLRQWMDFEVDINSPLIDVKQLLSYNGKNFLNEQITQEIIRKLDFKGHGRLLGNSFSEKGFAAELDIDRFRLQLNDYPAMERLSGRIVADTLGSIHLHQLKAKVGTMEFNTHLDLEHFLDKDLKNKRIKGYFKTPRIDVPELLAKKAAFRGQAGQSQPVATAKPDSSAHADAFNIFAFDFPDMELYVEIGRFTHEKYLLNNMKGTLRSTKAHQLYFDSLQLDASGGHLRLHGYFNGANPDNIYLDANLQMTSVDMSKAMYKLDNFGQDYLLSENLRGTLSGNVQLLARIYPDFTLCLSKMRASGELSLVNGRLLNFGPMRAMSDFMGERNLEDIRFAEMSNSFELADGQLSIPEMKIATTIGYLYMSGRQNLDKDLQMDYQLRLPLSLIREASWNFMKRRLFGRNRGNSSATSADDSADIPPDEELLEDEPAIISGQTGILRKYIRVNIVGTSTDYRISLGRRRR